MEPDPAKGGEEGFVVLSARNYRGINMAYNGGPQDGLSSHSEVSILGNTVGS